MKRKQMNNRFIFTLLYLYVLTTAMGQSLSGTDPKQELILRQYISVWNEGDTALLTEILDPAFVRIENGTAEVKGIEAIKRNVVGARNTLPDLVVTPMEVHAMDDMIVMRYGVSGTHKGTFMGVPPTGNKIGHEAVTLIRLKSGKIIEERVYYDNAGFLRKLGFQILPPSK